MRQPHGWGVAPTPGGMPLRQGPAQREVTTIASKTIAASSSRSTSRIASIRTSMTTVATPIGSVLRVPSKPSKVRKARAKIRADRWARPPIPDKRPPPSRPHHTGGKGSRTGPVRFPYPAGPLHGTHKRTGQAPAIGGIIIITALLNVSIHYFDGVKNTSNQEKMKRGTQLTAVLYIRGELPACV